MAQTNLYFNEEEEKKISYYKNKWKLSKPDTIRKIINQYNEDEK